MKFNSFTLFISLSGLLVVFLVAGAAGLINTTRPEPVQTEFFPTPTELITPGVSARSTIEIVSLDPILEATAPPINYDNLLEIEEDQARGTAEALETNTIQIEIDVSQRLREISPLVYGINASDTQVVEELRPPMYNWESNHAPRYNWRLGNAFNEGRDAQYKNENLFPSSENFALDFLEAAQNINAQTRFALPTIGWVAKDTFSCSFSTGIENPTCTTARESTCLSAEIPGNPNLTSIPSGPADMIEFLEFVNDNGYEFDILGLLHEPELWGITHYDIHNECTTPQEILETYIAYADVIKSYDQSLQLTGPGTCCYDFYWDTQGLQREDQLLGEPFLPWFLKEMRAYDEAAGRRHLDILDVHYFPVGLVNEDVDLVTAGHRLRAHRSLYDPLYSDESYINEPIRLIPRLRQMVNEHYPNTKIGLSAWDFGAGNTFNGALAIADVLGVFGKEGLHYASYAPALEQGTPAFYAFKLFTNYDNQGGRFGDIAVEATSTQPDLVTPYAAIDSETGDLHLIVVNKFDGIFQVEAEITWNEFESSGMGGIYTYSEANLDQGDAGIEFRNLRVGTVRQVINFRQDTIVHLVFEADRN